MNNQELKSKYDEMHSKGQSSWFSDGKEERELILKMGDPWEGKMVLEIGCGEGDLANLMYLEESLVWAIDYSREAINRAILRYPDSGAMFAMKDYRDMRYKYERIVMQGVLEHLDDPFKELKWMMDNLLTEKGDVITSSPCFLNPRGIIWMTLDMVGAVMSKTDLHFLNPWEINKFCNDNKFSLKIGMCDESLACGGQMVEDLKQRIPLALKDGNISFKMEKFDYFIKWIDSHCHLTNAGATAVYKITKGT